MSGAERLHELLDQWEEARAHGREVSAEELCRHDPDLLAEMIRRIAAESEWDTYTAPVGSPPSPPPSTVVGRYRVIRRVGRGGMGEVFLAHDDGLQREVALKCMREELLANPEGRRLFLREAEITGRLQHPGVVPIHDLVRTGQPWYAMRFIHGQTEEDAGQTLKAAIERFHRVPAPYEDVECLHQLLRRFLAVCQTIAYAHSQGIVHCDLKPDNMMLGAYGETLVVDWGLARRLTERETVDAGSAACAPCSADAGASRPDASSASAATPAPGRQVSGPAGGSPWYASPEQMDIDRQNEVGPASDIYSLGATLYHLLAGHPPKPPAPAPRKVRPAVPPALEAICRKAMHPRPAGRYVTAAALAEDVERHLDDQPVSAWREPWTMRARRWLRRHRTLVTAALTTLLAAVVLLGGFVVRLRVEKRKLEAANLALAEAKEKETAAREEAERNLRQALDQIRETLAVLYREDLVAYHNGAAYLAIQEVLSHQIDRFAQSAPPNEFGERIRLLRDIERLQQIEFTQRTGLPPALRSQLAVVRAGLEKFLQAHPGDPWAEVNLAKTHLIEAPRLHRTGQHEEARAGLVKAYAVFERHAVPGQRYGRDGARGAAAVVRLLSFAQRRGVRNEADLVLDRADQTLALLDTFDRYRLPSGDQEDPSEIFLDYLTRLDVLHAKAKTLFGLRGRTTEERRAAADLLQATEKCPAEKGSHPEVLQHRAVAAGFLAAFAMEDREYQRAWQLAQTACHDRDEAIRNIPGRADDEERHGLLLTKLATAQIGAEVLRSSDRRDPALRPWLLGVVRDALAALDDCEASDSSGPGGELDPAVVRAIRDCRQDLQRLQVELDEGATR
jgi:tRNA A-37 threonylcarbamoyl transferase component Bud32